LFNLSAHFNILLINIGDTMDIFRKKDIEQLMNPQDGLCCSIYMPTHRTGSGIMQNPILFKNLLNDAEKKFIAAGVKKQVTDAILPQGKSLIEDLKFWQNQSNGLAVFISAKDFLFYRVPQDFKQLVIVTSRFHIKPMIPVLSNNQSFNILGISQDQIRLFQCTISSITEIDLEGIPTNMKDALGYEDFERYLQFHTQTGGRNSAKRSAAFHGHGEDSREAKEDILRYFRIVDDGLKKYLDNDKTPLILAGVDYLIPIYRDASDRNNIMETGIKGNPDEAKQDDLHDNALKIIKPILEQKLESEIERFRELMGKGSPEASDDMKKIIFAAAHGRVDTLFVPVGKQLWGIVDMENNKVHTHKESNPGDEDLLDYAAGKTLVNSGSVFAVPPEKMPDELSLAAIFRY
jgi:hypothetical protein